MDHQLAEFHRSHFKKIVAHYFRNSNHVNVLLVQKMVQICVQSKTPQILLDIFFLAAQAGHKWDSEQARKFVEILSKFKVYNEDVFTVVNFFLNTSAESMEFKLIQPYLDKLVQNDQFEQLLYFFDKVRTSISRIAYKLDPKMSAAENNEALSKFEANKLALTKAVLSEFVNYLVEKRLFVQGELLFKNILQKKWLEKESDYLNGMTIYNENPEMFAAIYNDYKANESLTKNSAALTQIVKKVGANPIHLENIFRDILDVFVFSVALFQAEPGHNR